MSDRDKLKEKIAGSLRLKAEDFPPDSTSRHFLRSHALEAAEAALTAIEEAGCVIVPKEPTLDILTAVDWIGENTMTEVWRAMVGASPYKRTGGEETNV